MRLGGTITGEHGVGVEKVDLMAAQFSPAEISAFHRLKAAFDERGLLNPGKGIPTLARCREYTQTRGGWLFSRCHGSEVLMDATLAQWIGRVQDAVETGSQLVIPRRQQGLYGGAARRGVRHPRPRRHRQLRADRTGRRRPCRHAAGRVAGSAGRKGQCLPFEPPQFGGAATVGGMVAAGSQPAPGGGRRRARLRVLGVRLIDGRASCSPSAVRVMKNVAGYDVPRLMAGSLGTLGVLTEVALKVLPVPVAEQTLRFALSEAESLRKLNAWGGQVACRSRPRHGTTAR